MATTQLEGQQTFTYTAVSADGQRRKGKMDAEGPAGVAQALQAEGLIPVEIAEFKKTLGNMNITKPKDEQEAKLKAGDLVAFSRQLYLLVRSGLSLPRAIAIMGEDHDDVRFTRMCNDLSDKVLSGQPLSKAMEGYPGAFNEVFMAYISAGETTGNMEEALFRLNRMITKGYQLQLKIKAVTAYPKMVSYAIAVMVLGIMLFLVPMFAKIYDGLGQPLPAPTRILTSFANSLMPLRLSVPFVKLTSPTLYVLIAIFGFKRWRKSTMDDVELGMKLERIKFRMPILGLLWKYNVLYRWSSTMAGALHAGLQTFSALELAGKTSGSFWVTYVTEGLKDAVRSGRQLSTELAKHPDLFSPQMRAMAATGEEAGEPAIMFENVASTLEDELEAMVATLGAKIEVALLLIMGVVVGGLLVILYLPILNLASATGKGYDKEGTGG